MPPRTSEDFHRAASQRLDAAEVLLRAKHTLDAQYLGGYTVECSLKALILHRSPSAERATTLSQITRGGTWHRPEVLLGELRKRGVSLPLGIAKQMRRFRWTTDLRYETGRRGTKETIALLKTAKDILNWVKEELS